MVSGAIEKTAGLTASLFIILSAAMYIPDWSCVGLCVGAPSFVRLTYHFFHASIIHAVLNAWCLLSIIFLYKVSWSDILIAYVIAAIAPPFVLTALPTVGMSAVCYALLGLMVFKTRSPLRFTLLLIPYLIIGFFIPVVNAWLHLYSFVAGLMVSLLFIPIPCSKK